MYLDSKTMPENLHKASVESRHFVVVSAVEIKMVWLSVKNPKVPDNPVLPILVLNVFQLHFS